MQNNREIERKFTLDGRLSTVHEKLLEILDVEHYIFPCQTNDFYWAAPANSSVQFIRLRDSWGKTGEGFSRQLKEITVKSKDRGSNFNRLEYNLHVDSCENTKAVNTLLFGEPVQLYKNESVIFTKDKAIISLAEINGKLFLEVEGPSENFVSSYCEKLKRAFVLRPEEASLYETFIQPAKVRNSP